VFIQATPGVGDKIFSNVIHMLVE